MAMKPPEHLNIAGHSYSFKYLRKVLRHIDHSINSYQLTLTYGDAHPQLRYTGIFMGTYVSGFEFKDEESLNKEYERVILEWKKWEEAQ